MIGWVELDFFWPTMVDWVKKSPLPVPTRPMHTLNSSRFIAHLSLSLSLSLSLFVSRYISLSALPDQSSFLSSLFLISQIRSCLSPWIHLAQSSMLLTHLPTPLTHLAQSFISPLTQHRSKLHCRPKLHHQSKLHRRPKLHWRPKLHRRSKLIQWEKDKTGKEGIHAILWIIFLFCFVLFCLLLLSMIFNKY